MITAIPRKTRRPVFKPSPEVLAELYACYTAAEIADMYGVKEATVRSWIHRQRQRAAQKQEGETLNA